MLDLARGVTGPISKSSVGGINLGTMADIPVFACRYSDDFTEWIITPLNDKAKLRLPNKQTMTERQWVTFLYELRGYTPPDELFNGSSVRI
jgi:hypothetical protein